MSDRTTTAAVRWIARQIVGRVVAKRVGADLIQEIPRGTGGAAVGGGRLLRASTAAPLGLIHDCGGSRRAELDADAAMRSGLLRLVERGVAAGFLRAGIEDDELRQLAEAEVPAELAEVEVRIAVASGELPGGILGAERE